VARARNGRGRSRSDPNRCPCGPAIVGNFGGIRFFDYTAFGDTINIAARLEVASKQLGTRVCVIERVARQVGNFRGGRWGDHLATEEYLSAFAIAEWSDRCADRDGLN
jgi:class 3 adenylate cyclase